MRKNDLFVRFDLQKIALLLLKIYSLVVARALVRPPVVSKHNEQMIAFTMSTMGAFFSNFAISAP